MSGEPLSVSGWSPAIAAERAVLHVRMALAEGGFARAVPLGDGRVVWVSADGKPWRHVPDGYRLKLADDARGAELAREARKMATQAAVAAKRVDLAAGARAAQVRKRAEEARAVRRAEPIPNSRQMRRAIALMEETAARHGVSVEAMIGPRWARGVTDARDEAMWLVREMRNVQGDRLFGFARLARLFRRDAAVVVRSLRRHATSAGLAFEDEAAVRQAWRPAA